MVNIVTNFCNENELVIFDQRALTYVLRIINLLLCGLHGFDDFLNVVALLNVFFIFYELKTFAIDMPAF